MQLRRHGDACVILQVQCTAAVRCAESLVAKAAQRLRRGRDARAACLPV